MSEKKDGKRGRKVTVPDPKSMETRENTKYSEKRACTKVSTRQNNISRRTCKCPAADPVHIGVRRFRCSHRFDIDRGIVCDGLRWTNSEEAGTGT